MTWREIIGRLAAWRQRDSLDRDLADNIDLHLDYLARDLERDGLSPADARAAARRQLGNVTALRESSREAWGFPAIDVLLQDARYALRALRRSPTFAVAIVTTIALGIGAATATFTVVNGVLLTPPPYAEPGRLVTIYTVFPEFRGKPTTNEIWNVLRTPYPDYVRYRDTQKCLSSVAGINIGSMSVTIGQETIDVPSSQGTANLLSTLGFRMARGRWFTDSEEGKGSPQLLVLSHAFWKSRLASDEHALGRVITLDEKPYEVIGILPESFAIRGQQVGTQRDVQPDVWIPIGANGRGYERGNHTLDIIGRLRAGMTIATAAAEAEPLLRGTAKSESDRRTSRMVPRLDVEVGPVRRPLWLLFGAVALFLCITGANVASLFLGECAARQAEFRTRLVLGAGRARLTRLILTQSTIVSLAGAAGGVALAWVATRTMLTLAPEELPHAAQIGVDVRVLLFTIALTALMAIVSSVAPALLLSREHGGTNALAGGRVVAGRSRVQLIAISIQAAGAVALVAGAGLLAQSLFNEEGVNPGFTPGTSFQMQVTLPRSLTPAPEDTRRLYGETLRLLESVPGVTRVTAMSTPPLSGRTNGQSVRKLPIIDATQPGMPMGRAVVWHNYFDVMHVRLVAGRSFTASDTAGGAEVAVISEAMAKLFWSVETAVGQQFKHPNGIATVIGVAADVRNRSLTKAAEALFYLPAAQSSTPLTFIVHTRVPPAGVIRSAERAVWQGVPGATISDVSTTQALVDRALAPSRYRALLASIFAGLAVVMTLVGVAGLTVRAVTSRKAELCIRMALGLTTTSARVLAIQSPLAAAGLGALVGTGVAVFASRWIAAYLFEVGALDAGTYGATIVFIVATCAMATVGATRSLRRADLAETLRRT